MEMKVLWCWYGKVYFDMYILVLEILLIFVYEIVVVVYVLWIGYCFEEYLLLRDDLNIGCSNFLGFCGICV